MIEDPWPWRHPVPDGHGSEDQCSVCWSACREEAIEALVDAQGRQQFCCPQCAEEIKRDFNNE